MGQVVTADRVPPPVVIHSHAGWKRLFVAVGFGGGFFGQQIPCSLHTYYDAGSSFCADSYFFGQIV